MPWVYLSFRFSMKSSMVTWSKSTSRACRTQGLHRPPSCRRGKHPGQVAPTFLCRAAEGGVLSHRPSPPCPQPPRLPPQQCGEVEWVLLGPGKVCPPACCPLPRGSDPASWFPPLRACLTVEVEAVKETPTLCDLTLTPSRGASAVPGPADHLWDPEEISFVVLAAKLCLSTLRPQH